MKPATKCKANVSPLEGKVVVLTGGAGTSGRGLATELAQAGARLVLASRNVAALKRVAQTEEARGYKVHAIAYDQRDEKSILRLRDRVIADFGKVDGLVNSAVVWSMTSLTDPLRLWQRSMRRNADGLFAIMRAFAAPMAKPGFGSIVNIGSIKGVVGPTVSLYDNLDMPVQPNYFFNKGGRTSLTRFFAAYYGAKGVRVNCIAADGFRTKDMNPIFVKRYEREIFLRRMADDQDLGGPVTFLLSESSRSITGVTLPVDGGYTAHLNRFRRLRLVACFRRYSYRDSITAATSAASAMSRYR